MHVLLCSFMRKAKRVESQGSFYLNSECQDRTCGLWTARLANLQSCLATTGRKQR